MTDSVAEHENTTQKKCNYVLCIKEHLSPDWSDNFEGLTVTYTPTGETQLSGFVPDQSALHGLLARVQDFNLTLISVNRLANHESSDMKINEFQSKIKLEE